MSTEQANQSEKRPTVNADQEAWVKARILTAIRMAIECNQQKAAGADEPILSCAIEGIVNGAAVEILQTLGMEPEYVNLWAPQHVLLNPRQYKSLPTDKPNVLDGPLMECEMCNGTGMIARVTCTVCGGTGKTPIPH